MVKILPPAPQISNILHLSAGKYNIQDHSTCIYVFLDFVFCLCYCGSRDRRNPGDRAGGVSYTALSCNFPTRTLYLQKNPNESTEMTTSPIYYRKVLHRSRHSPETKLSQPHKPSVRLTLPPWLLTEYFLYHGMAGSNCRLTLNASFRCCLTIL